MPAAPLQTQGFFGLLSPSLLGVRRAAWARCTVALWHQDGQQEHLASRGETRMWPEVRRMGFDERL
eukprot:9442143-Alexandrium_andersonii.AAC.1